MYICNNDLNIQSDKSRLACTLQKIKEEKRRFFKTRREGDVMTCCGRLFHTCDAATGNDRSPTVVRRVQWTTSVDDDVERSLYRAWNQLDD